MIVEGRSDCSGSTMQELVGVETVIVEPDERFRDMLRRILSDSRFRVVAEFPHLDDFPSEILPAGVCAMMLIGVDVDSPSAIHRIASLKAQHPHLRMVILSAYFDPQKLIATIETGVDGYVLKEVSPEALKTSMEIAFEGGIVVPYKFVQFIRTRLRRNATAQPWADPPSVLTELFTRDATLPLSDKQQSILYHLMQGASNKDIAQELQISETTVQFHVKGILQKIRVRNRTQAAIWAVKNMCQFARPR
jgi:two-component system nitrate/nitrite response regulator NarL